ncbi:ribosomal protein L7/L12 [Jannaschia pohangensis]|uniref:Ribosomal protein L7/L12 C-terminal domain-containing protein n=1 Tax=Jannaschia pohangensis TaxID=390807 RepID=A0A1I3TFL5_9RHOB|nr:ribosomal protein L7/L12 [Jannaschia pohangensis]SFJ69974.1 Ribosomal protein L7/L12 C-terminal domain-containing protein [Jannaschia pohangensis]
MITIDAAREIAKRHVQSLGEDLMLFDKPITFGDYGWVFSFQSKVFIETNDIRDALVGNAPILVDSDKGQIFTLGTAYEVSKYINIYQRFGDPHAEPGSFVELSGWSEGANKVMATKIIKELTQLGLKDAKGAVEACLEGQRPIVHCADPESAEILAHELSVVGFDARQLAL